MKWIEKAGKQAFGSYRFLLVSDCKRLLPLLSSSSLFSF